MQKVKTTREHITLELTFAEFGVLVDLAFISTHNRAYVNPYHLALYKRLQEITKGVDDE